MKKRVKNDEDVDSTLENQEIINLSQNSRFAKIEMATRSATMRSTAALNELRELNSLRQNIFHKAHSRTPS